MGVREDGRVSKVYCTYFDKGYAPRGLAMIASIRSVGETGPVYVVCFDDEAAAAVEGARLSDVHVVRLAELEQTNPELLAVKPSRGRVEYYFTSTPTVVTHALGCEPEADWVTYLDADLWFFSSPDDLYVAQEPGSVAIIEHGYRTKDAWRKKFGTYNVGWVSFRNDDDGRACLEWWRQRCIEWCFDRAEPGRFADQGYLDQFATIVQSVVVLDHPGANLAPWNLATRRVTCETERVLVDGRPLVFFHFHGLQQRGARWYFAHARYGAKTTTCIRDGLYRRYIEALVEEQRAVNATEVSGPRRRGSLTGAAKHAAVRLLARLRGDSVVVEHG
jgi:hypothetical protein